MKRPHGAWLLRVLIRAAGGEAMLHAWQCAALWFASSRLVSLYHQVKGPKSPPTTTLDLAFPGYVLRYEGSYDQIEYLSKRAESDRAINEACWRFIHNFGRSSDWSHSTWFNQWLQLARRDYHA